MIDAYVIYSQVTTWEDNIALQIWVLHLCFFSDSVL
jgi:hypothetical protein